MRLLLRLLVTFVLTQAALGLSLNLADAQTGAQREVLFQQSGQPYIGQVATRTYIANNATTSQKQVMARSWHQARDNITSLQLIIPNFSGIGGESGSGGIATVTASIEYPPGTCTQVKFSGSASTTIANPGFVISDPVAVSIPNLAALFARIYFTNPTGIIWSSNANLTLGDAMTFGASGVVDQTVSCDTVVATGGGLNTFHPIGIIALTRKKSYCLFGDSKQWGQGDSSSTLADVGETARSIGPNWAYMNFGNPGAQIIGEVSNFTLRKQIAAYCSGYISQYGINDFNAGATAAQVETAQQTLRNFFPGKPFYLGTVGPRTTSTDSWATLVNQTAFAGNAQRVTYNTDVRAGLSFASGFFEIANPVESSQNSGLWPVTGAANYCTADGTHETPACYQNIQNSGNVNPAKYN